VFERFRWLLRAPRASSSDSPAAVLDKPMGALSTLPSLQFGPPPARLTRREIEILLLLAQRYTNREIAEELVLSVCTVERHINNIFNKTGLRCRRAARDFCRQHRLLPTD
jgi:DNA-binding NarL/FixJ family response regulator